MNILVMESSTTSAKAMIYNSENGIQDVINEPYPEAAAAVDGLGTHDQEAIFAQTLNLGRKVAQGTSVDAIVPCGTFHNIMVLSRDMQPVTPAFTWTYPGGSGIAAELRRDSGFTDRFYHRTGCMVHANYPAFMLYKKKKDGISLSDKFICSQSSYNLFKLTGEKVTTACNESGSGMINIHTRDWDNEILSVLGIQRSGLPRLTTYREKFSLTQSAAALLGLPAGIPVLPNYPDGALNQVGAGGLREGVMTFSVGTSGALRLSSNRPVLPEVPSTWCYLSPNAWLSGAATSGACNCIDWAKETLFPMGVSYAKLDQASADMRGLPLFLPFLFGERCPGWHDDWRGGFEDIQPYHTAFDLYRSVQEGILFNLYQCYRILTSLNEPPKRIQLSGGILNSRLWKQMCCDLFGVSMEISNIPHASMIGAAVLALESCGLLPAIEDFSVPAGEIQEPDMISHAVYQERFDRYLELYKRKLS